MTAGECHLCNLPVGPDPITDEEENPYCCQGCREVQSTLGDVDGTTDEDELRESLDIDETTSVPEEYERAFFKVEGMHCGSCEVFIESLAAAEDGIGGAEANYVTETARVDYDPEEVDEETVIDRLSGRGYTAYRRDDHHAKREATNRSLLRMIVGLLFGMKLMALYLFLIYPVHFGFFLDQGTLDLIGGWVDNSTSRGLVLANLVIATTIVLGYTGLPIIKGAYVSLLTRRPNMDLLIILAAASAYAYSTLAIAVGYRNIYDYLYYDVTVAIILVVTIGTYYEREIKQQATGLLSELTLTQVTQARRYEDGDPTVVDVSSLEGGEELLVRAGERVPVDGTVVDGDGTVDEAVVTGESLPESKAPGDKVVGGSVLEEGSLVITADEGAGSSLDRITELVWNLQTTEQGIQKLANTLATIFVPAVAAIAIIATALYLGLGAAPTAAALIGLTVLIVSCPCALGLATPLAVASSVREAMERGIVVFDDTVFERLRDVDTVVFDKTGTLTTGDMSVVETEASDELLSLAATLEQRSAHPIAEAIAETFDGVPTADGGAMATGEVTAFESHKRGVSGTVDGTKVLVGHPALFVNQGWAVPDDLDADVDAAREFGRVPVLVGTDGAAEGLIVVGDEPRAGWEEILEDLNREAVDVVVLTGDDERAATYFRNHTAVDQVFAGVPPEGKAETVDRLEAQGPTAMVGDGTNDAPALARSSLGIALGSGTAIAADAADIAIVTDDLRSIQTVFDLSAAAGRRVKQNIGWAFLYNAIAIPLALTGLLNPLFAALAMASSSLIVVGNSSRRLLK